MKKTAMEANLEKLKSEKRTKDPNCRIEDVGNWGIATYPTLEKQHRDLLLDEYTKDKAKRKTQSTIAKKPRNSVTKVQLEKFKMYFIEEKYLTTGKRTSRGWKAEACEKFLIDPGTLKKRMMD